MATAQTDVASRRDVDAALVACLTSLTSLVTTLDRLATAFAATLEADAARRERGQHAVRQYEAAVPAVAVPATEPPAHQRSDRQSDR